MNALRTILETAGGCYELLRLAAISRLRFRGPYWSWRMHTAFGRGMPASRADLFRSVLAYGRWMWRTRRGR